MQYVTNNSPPLTWVGVRGLKSIVVELTSRVNDCLIGMTTRFPISDVSLTALRRSPLSFESSSETLCIDGVLRQPSTFATRRHQFRPALQWAVLVQDFCNHNVYLICKTIGSDFRRSEKFRAVDVRSELLPVYHFQVAKTIGLHVSGWLRSGGNVPRDQVVV